MTEATVRPLFDCGVDVITSGDHAFRRKEVEAVMASTNRVIRPANYPSNAPGRGSVLVETKEGLKIAVLNLIGRVFLKSVDCPFEAARNLTDQFLKQTPLIFVDIHAEAT
jgi:2',3'-cyclic-nucleotide 2'-phosphodiesterase